jgi:hypothetical protein
MTDENKAVVHCEFAENGSANFNITIGALSPWQLAALAAHLTEQSRIAIDQFILAQAQQAQASHILTPAQLAALQGKKAS